MTNDKLDRKAASVQTARAALAHGLLSPLGQAGFTARRRQSIDEMHRLRGDFREIVMHMTEWDRIATVAVQTLSAFIIHEPTLKFLSKCPALTNRDWESRVAVGGIVEHVFQMTSMPQWKKISSLDVPGSAIVELEALVHQRLLPWFDDTAQLDVVVDVWSNPETRLFLPGTEYCVAARRWISGDHDGAIDGLERVRDDFERASRASIGEVTTILEWFRRL